MKSMPLERYIIGIVLISSAAASWIMIELGSDLASFALLLPLAVSLIFLIHIKRQLRNLADSIALKKSLGLSAMLSGIESKVKEQDQRFGQITKVIGSIGDDGQVHDSITIDGEVGKALQDLQSKLKSVKQEESTRIWAAQGIAKIGEIRRNNSEMQDYCFKIISELVKYLDANQGAFYSIEEEGEEQHLELLATYAYARRKYHGEKVKIQIGEGLAGQCVLERHMIFMTQVPNNYVKITSGLGAATPGCISIIPLIYREEVFGVIEIAAFAKFEPYKIDFIKKVCDGIALELSGIRAQEKTRKLLEQSQEEELRQSLKEMESAQKEMVKKEEALSRQLQETQRAMAMAESERTKNEAILEGCMDAVISFNEHGSIEYFNRAAEEIFGYTREEIIGTPAERILNIYIEAGDESVSIRSTNGSEVTVRTEINASNSQGEEISLLLTATKVKIGKHYLFTLFAQKVSVDLF